MLAISLHLASENPHALRNRWSLLGLLQYMSVHHERQKSEGVQGLTDIYSAEHALVRRCQEGLDYLAEDSQSGSESESESESEQEPEEETMYQRMAKRRRRE